jgi:capsular exopolysaccharide synthesis family protein
MNRKNIFALDNPKSPVAEAYRTLRTNIQFSSLDKELKSIVITSSSPKEGKTTTICNLAVTMAQSGNKVLLMDCDLRKSQLHHYFELNNDQGLTNVLAQQVSFEEAVKETVTVGLDVLPSGPKPPNPSELLGSNAMKEFVKKMEEKYDKILIDAPPVGIVTDASILSTIADGTILVIASGQVAIEAAQRSKALLQKVNANIIGILLNKLPREGRGYYGYYYYHYYDDEGNIQYAKKRKKNSV